MFVNIQEIIFFKYIFYVGPTFVGHLFDHHLWSLFQSVVCIIIYILMKDHCISDPSHFGIERFYNILCSSSFLPEWDLNMGLSRIAVFQDCKATALTTQPPRLDSSLSITVLLFSQRKDNDFKSSFTLFLGEIVSQDWPPQYKHMQEEKYV